MQKWFLSFYRFGYFQDFLLDGYVVYMPILLNCTCLVALIMRWTGKKAIFIFVDLSFICRDSSTAVYFHLQETVY